MDERNGDDIDSVNGDSPRPPDVNDEGREQVQKRDPFTELTSEMMRLLGHINEFVLRLEDEDSNTDASERQGLSTKPGEDDEESSGVDVKEQLLLSSELKGQAYQILSKTWEIVTPDESEKERVCSEAQSSEPTCDEVQADLETCSSAEIVEKEDGPPEKTIPEGAQNTELIEKDGDEVRLSSVNDKKDVIVNMEESIRSQLQSHIDDTLKLREVNKEVALILERITRCMIRKQCTLKTETLSSQLSENALPVGRDRSTVTTDCQDKPQGNCTDDKAANDSQTTEKSETEGIEKNDPEKPEHEESGSEANTDNDYSSQTSSTVGEETTRNCVITLNEHLKLKLEPIYQHVSVDGPKHSPTHKFKCLVGNLTTEGIGHSRRSAKHDAALRMIRLIIRKQKDGTLPGNISPFSDQQLQELSPLLDSETENHVNHLQHQCYALHLGMPVYTLLQDEESSEEKLHTVQCSLSNFNTIGKGLSKKEARKMAAKDMLQLIEKL